MKSSRVEILEGFATIDTSDFPHFYDYEKSLERGLWVLWVAKERLGTRKLTAGQIASIIRDIKEISIDARSITNSFNKAGDKIHTSRENRKTCFEIMKPGKDHLISQGKEGSVQVFYFEPDKRYISKRILSKNILNNLKGKLRILDPYCGERTLDILHKVKNRVIMFLTRVDNLRRKDKDRFLRELRDFKSENPNIEFRNYPYADIHDRYIISTGSLIILGHSMKDLGSKESFAIVLNKDANKNIFEDLTENFNRRWKKSVPLNK